MIHCVSVLGSLGYPVREALEFGDICLGTLQWRQQGGSFVVWCQCSELQVHHVLYCKHMHLVYIMSGFSLGPFSMVLRHATSSVSCIIYYAVSMPQYQNISIIPLYFFFLGRTLILLSYSGFPMAILEAGRRGKGGRRRRGGSASFCIGATADVIFIFFFTTH